MSVIKYRSDVTEYTLNNTTDHHNTELFSAQIPNSQTSLLHFHMKHKTHCFPHKERLILYTTVDSCVTLPHPCSQTYINKVVQMTPSIHFNIIHAIHVHCE